MKNEKSVGGIVYREEDKEKFFLLLNYKRINDDKGVHTYWDFPKGHVEGDETEIHTLFREVEEETGIADLKVIEGFREIIKYFFNLKGQLIHKEVVFFICKTGTKDVVISDEHIGSAWAQYEEAMKKLEFKNSKDVLEKAHTFLSRKKITDW